MPAPENVDGVWQRHDKTELTITHWLSLKTELRDQPLLLLYLFLQVLKSDGRGGWGKKENKLLSGLRHMTRLSVWASEGG